MTCPTRFRSFTLFHIELKFSFRVPGITIQTNNLIFLFFLHNKVCIISINKTYTSRASSIPLRVRKAGNLYSLRYRPEDEPVKASKAKNLTRLAQLPWKLLQSCTFHSGVVANAPLHHPFSSSDKVLDLVHDVLT